jgi:hypothetical protein
MARRSRGPAGVRAALAERKNHSPKKMRFGCDRLLRFHDHLCQHVLEVFLQTPMGSKRCGTMDSERGTSQLRPQHLQFFCVGLDGLN